MGLLRKKPYTIANPDVGFLVIHLPRVFFLRAKFYYKPSLSGSKWYRVLFKDFEQFEEFMELDNSLATMSFLRQKNLLKDTRVAFQLIERKTDV